MCAGCAFRPGSEAYTYSPTQLKVRLCQQSGEPFFCHEVTSPDGAPVLCAGYIAERDNMTMSDGVELPPDARSAAVEFLRMLRGEASFGPTSKSP
jgi:hypothetical protein